MRSHLRDVYLSAVHRPTETQQQVSVKVNMRSLTLVIQLALFGPS
jgi:hypothetical protein